MKAAQDEPWLMRSFRADSSSRFATCTVAPAAPSASSRQQQVLTGSADGAVLAWSLSPGRPPRPLKLGSHQGQVTCIVASARGGLLASCSVDATVMLWRNQVSSQRPPAVLRMHFCPVRACDISGDERLVLSAADDKLVKLSSVSERKFIASFVGHSNWVRTAAFASSARLMASGGDDRTARLWDVEHHTEVRCWHDQADAVTRVHFDPQESAVAACSAGSTINIFDLRSEELRQHYSNAHGSSPITQIMFHPKKDLLLSASRDRTLRLWDLRAGRLRFTVAGHEFPVHAGCWDCSGGSFASCDDLSIHLWALPDSSADAGETAHGAGSISAQAPPHLRRSSLAQAPTAPGRAGRCSQSAEQAASKPQPIPDHERVQSTPQDISGRAYSFRPGPPEMRAAAGKPAFDPEFVPPAPARPPVYPAPAAFTADHFSAAAPGVGQCQMVHQIPVLDTSTNTKFPPELSEVVARSMEQMVTQMDTLTRSLQAMESRLMCTEAAVAELATLMPARQSLGETR
mmetsp:Transcript_4041/g.7159  ORF Transcript_4041/g.7159 Transcript_4041/m.7159 type:complete len:516 (-) Transcript_4041:54-1601(-)